MHLITAKPIQKNVTIAIVLSLFNENITEKLYQGVLARLQELNIAENHITVAKVPGAIEIPITAQALLDVGNYDAIIALGAVVRGETTHYDYVCQQVSRGCQEVSLEFNVPIIFGVLTTENEEQALDRCGGEHGHKGREAVDAALAMISILKEIEGE